MLSALDGDGASTGSGAVFLSERFVLNRTLTLTLILYLLGIKSRIKTCLPFP